MKKFAYIFLALALVVFSSCEKKQKIKVAPGVHAVKVEKNINASNYTYLEVTENGNEYWIAVPQIKVKEGETLYFSKSMEMKNFKSPTLNRTFKSILFVEDISQTPPAEVNQSPESLTAAHKGVTTESKENVSIKPFKGGMTIAEIYSEKNKLDGKVVKIKGKVTKYNPGIMDRNWIHIQDGTQSNGNYDLLITSNDAAQVGQVITVEGKVALNKDFGAGYSYKVMLENGKVLSKNKPI